MKPPFVARVDDLVDGESYEFIDPSHALVARHHHEVVPTLKAVEHAASQGLWAVGFVSYEAAPGLDRSLVAKKPVAEDAFADVPLVWFGLFAKRQRAATLVGGLSSSYHVEEWRPDIDPVIYGEKVDAVRARIAAGDTYQCNLTIRLASHVQGDLFALYRDLALAQHGAYNTYIDTGHFVVASASPELFFSWTGDELTTRPMKGTAPRGRYGAEDDARGAALLASVKDRAENVMIVDLLRNDVGKLAHYGGVTVPELFSLERYDTVWHLTSTVTARLREQTTLSGIFAGLFPCGSVTGAPKSSTMALIAELEDSTRSVYCGAVGVVAPPQEPLRAQFNVAIRTVLIDRETGRAQYGTGGGIIWDSVAAAEHAELMTKAAILEHPHEPFALLETMAYVPEAGIRNKDRHLARLCASAAYFGYRIERRDLEALLYQGLEDHKELCRVRLVVLGDGTATLEMREMPAPSDEPARLALDTRPIDSSDPMRFHKTTNRAFYDTRRAARPDVDDVILVNERGEVTETTIANLAVRIDGSWCTPQIDAGLLPGVERERLLDDGLLRETRIVVGDLEHADELALVSSLRGWRRAVLVHDRDASSVAAQ